MTERRSKEERDANKVLMAVAANEAMSEHLAARSAFQKNYEKLRTERLVREAAGKEKSIVQVEGRINGWNKREDETLRSITAQRAPAKEIAAAVNRATPAVYGRIPALKRRSRAN